MSQLSENTVTNLDTPQAVELLRVMEQQAAWENLRESTAAKDVPTSQLKDRQRAYEAYRSRLAAYTSKHRTFPLPELSQNSPKWVAQWFRVVRAVLDRASRDAAAETPLHLVAKAHRLAARVAERLKRPAADAAPQPANLAAAVVQIDALIAWGEAPVEVQAKAA